MLHASPYVSPCQCQPHISLARAAITTGVPSRQTNLKFGPMSRVCLGTMFYGAATDTQHAHRLLSLAAERGLNFFDTAEMYPVPQSAMHQGQSEVVLGQWLKRQRREDCIVATKVAGPSAQMEWIRGGPTSLNAQNIQEALDDSLMRLQTDYIDIFQLHWPDRYVPMFGEVDFQPANSYASVPLEEQMGALTAAVTAGKLLHGERAAAQLGADDESVLLLVKYFPRGQQEGQAPISFIQNAYSLLCRTFDSSLTEVCHEEGVGLLAYSPLAMGLLTGKYLSADGGPKEARLNKYKGRYAEAESRYGPRPNVTAAVQAYVSLAKESGISPTALALRFVLSHPLVAAVVTGAMDRQQLTQLLDIAEEPPLQDSIMHAIDTIHQQYPNPCP